MRRSLLAETVVREQALDTTEYFGGEVALTEYLRDGRLRLHWLAGRVEPAVIVDTVTGRHFAVVAMDALASAQPPSQPDTDLSRPSPGELIQPEAPCA